MEHKDELIDRDLTLTVILPGGVEKTAIVHGSKPMMDLLVMLCAKYHLNPSNHTIELISANRNHITFKPNALIGSLEADTVLLKPKGADKNRTTLPQVPEATVRLIINYRKTQKSVLRVNPQVALQDLLPDVCEKCELEPKRTVLLRDVCSHEPLDLTKSLNDFGLREVYAKEVKGNDLTNLLNSSGHQENKGSPQMKDKTVKEKENRGLFSLFKRRKKRSDQRAAASAPASPLLRKQGETSPDSSMSVYSSNTMPSDVPKKRRAPLPPMMMSQSMPSNLDGHRAPPAGLSEQGQVHSGLSRGCSSESSLKRTKRKAPPPPCAVDSVDLDSTVNAGVIAENVLEEIREQEEGVCATALGSCTVTSCDEDDSSLNLSADASVDSGKTDLTFDPADLDMQSSLLSEGMEENQMANLTSDGKLPMSSVIKKDQVQNAEVMGIALMDPTETDTELNHQRDQFEENGSLLDEDEKEHMTVQQHGPLSPAPSSSVCQELRTQEARVQAFHLQGSNTLFGDKMEKAGEPSEVQEIFCLSGKAGAHSGAEFASQGPSTAETTVAIPSRLMKDMATSTEELRSMECQVTSALPPEMVNGQMKHHVATGYPIYAKESKTKLKPSNELTRDYTPKMGLTTYTIVPQKTLEKLRIFEVELTLEAPSSVAKQDLAANLLGAAYCQAQTEQRPLAEMQQDPHIWPPGDDCHRNGGSVSSDSGDRISEIQSQQGPVLPVAPKGEAEAFQLSLPSEGGIKPARVPEIKRKKTPPPTKPKPTSFRLPQHKGTPVCCVTSAAVRGASGSPGRRCSEEGAAGQGRNELPQEPAAATSRSPPAPPPTVDFEQEATGVPREMEKTPGRLVSEPHHHIAIPAGQRPTALSLEKLRSFAAPKPYTPVSPSRFALAVSSAVKRSQSLTAKSSMPAACSQAAYMVKAQCIAQSSSTPPQRPGDETKESGDCEEIKVSAAQGAGHHTRALPAAETDAREAQEECNRGAFWEDWAAESTMPDAQVILNGSSQDPRHVEQAE